MSIFSGFATTGDSDVSPDNTASQFLLLRGLEPGVSEELMAKGVIKLYKSQADPSETHVAKKTKIASTSNDASFGAKEGSLRRVLLVRDRKSNESWRYGFAEFGTVEDAQAAMAKYNAAEKFTISSKPVLVSYIHAGVFVPVIQPPSAEFARFTFSPLMNPSVKLMYWDEAAYVNELVITKEETSALAKAKESIKAKLAAAATKEGLVKEGAKKRKAEKDAPAPNTKKVVAPHLQFWTNRHAELHGLPPKDTEESADQSISTENKIKSEAPPSRSYADLNRKCCLLCSRQFKTEAEVHKHERVSQLHRDNMQKEDMVAKALAGLAKAQKTVADADSAYRDRAKERRQAFNQPKQPAAQHNKPKEPVAPKEEAPAPPAPSKGAALLGKMGWTAGEGLGAQGTGRTEAISTDLYTQGVGLGAEGGKVGDAIEEANRSTKGSYADFVSKSKDKAKERYERMG
jgi:RNA-binding protein 5/10